MEFKKILIANRGEIAVRISRTCKELGIDTVSIHSTADEDSLHVKVTDESVCVGPPKSALSYLNYTSILSAAEITGADAIHPGFGFLSENREFAELCEKWHIKFIGPNPKCIELLGDKIVSKKIAEEAGLPLLKPIAIKGRALDKVIKDVDQLGLPVLVKASAGGGGRGMQKVESIEDLPAILDRLKRESFAAFGDDTLFIEKYIKKPRHIEVQILADTYGNVIHLGERDCTIQRRYQKLIEESPSPVISEKTRKELCDYAVKLAKHVSYDSVGTVEFLYDMENDKFYFMEMNTRIQVEHPVTEERTNVDLIAEQIRVAQGESLRFSQEDIEFWGHSIECRINAEDPKTQTPSPGLVEQYYRPGGIGVRVDDFIYSGYNVPPFYDSMLAKIIVSAPTRNEAIIRMKRALSEMIINGISTNVELHKMIIGDADFVGNNYATDFLVNKLK